MSRPRLSAREDVRQAHEGNGCPTLSEFLHAPIEDVRAVAPETIIYAGGGTRRRAVLDGLSPISDEYALTSRNQLFHCLDLILHHGVSNCFVTLLAEMNFREDSSFRKNMIDWVTLGVTSPDMMDDYARYGWRVKLIGTESIPELASVAEQLTRATENNSGPMVGFLVASNPEAAWQSLLERASHKGITTRSEAIRAVYGGEIPPATMFIGSGKPSILPSIVPPLLIGDLQCYWTQHLGYRLDARLLRTIFYDYAYMRRTWRKDKTSRAERALAYREAWDNPPVVGLGVRVGPYWYPAPIEPPPVTWSQDVEI